MTKEKDDTRFIIISIAAIFIITWLGALAIKNYQIKATANETCQELGYKESTDYAISSITLSDCYQIECDNIVQDGLYCSQSECTLYDKWGSCKDTKTVFKKCLANESNSTWC